MNIITKLMYSLQSGHTALYPISYAVPFRFCVINNYPTMCQCKGKLQKQELLLPLGDSLPHITSVLSRCCKEKK